MEAKILREELINQAGLLGSDLTGIAPAGRLAGAPAGHRPSDLMPDAKSVVVLAKAIPTEVVANLSRLTFYTKVVATTISQLDDIAYSIACFLERKGGRALPVPADDPYTSWDEARRHGMGELSHKDAAVAAGLGEIGKSGLLLTPRFGNRVHLVSVLTDLKIEPDAPLEPSLCLPNCRRCIESCTVQAITETGRVIQKNCRENCGTTLPRGFGAYSCWECRRVCPAGVPT